jgi:trypsin
MKCEIVNLSRRPLANFGFALLAIVASISHEVTGYKNQQQQQQQQKKVTVESLLSIFDVTRQRTWRHRFRRSLQNDQMNNTVTAEPEIIGGTEAYLGEFPWFTSVAPDSLFYCGASLVAPDVLLTAAHCGPAFPNQAIVGTYRLKDANVTGSYTVNVVKKLYNPNFVTYKANDLLLMKISPVITSIAPITLNFNASLPVLSNILTIMGIGLTSYASDSLYYLSDILMKAQVNVISTQQCMARFGSIVNGSIHICVKDNSPLRVACGGDSGSPLVLWDNATAEYIQLGVLSFGAGNCSLAPSVYERLSFYQSFLQQGICKLTDYFPPDWSCCPTEQKKYDKCLVSNNVTQKEATECLSCVNTSMPINAPGECAPYQKAIFQAPQSCGSCAPSCARPLQSLLECMTGCSKCKVKRKKCRKSRQCCDMLVCRKNRCKPCKQSRKKCQSNDDCCSHKCKKAKCR